MIDKPMQNISSPLDLVYDLEEFRYTDVKELSLEKLRELLAHYNVFDIYKKRVVEEIKEKSLQESGK